MKLLILGSGGPVGVSLLYLIKKRGWQVSVVDPKQPKHLAIHQKELHGTLLDWTTQQYTLEDLENRLRVEKFDMVIDLTPTLDKRKSITICDELNIPLINSTMVDYKDDIHIAAFNFLDSRPAASRCAHIVASGMNPGAINAMAEEIIVKHGQPDSIIYWEYDDGAPADGRFKRLSTTWCQGESHAELTEDWNFEVLEEGTVLLHEDALSWDPAEFNFGGIPLDTLPIPPDADAFLIGHEECVYMGWRHDTACKFIYGFHPENMQLIRAAGYGGPGPDLLVNEPGKTLLGRDIMGVAVQYEGEDDDSADTWYGAFVMLDNVPTIPPDTNATCWLVAAGIAASAIVLAEDKLKPGVYLTHEIKGWMKAFRSMIEVHTYTIIDDEEEDEDEVEERSARAAMVSRRQE